MSELWHHSFGFQDLADVRVAAKDLMARSLVHTRGGGYGVHDMVLDFAKFKIKESTVVMEEAALRQAQYLGRPEVLGAYSDKGDVDEGFFSLISLWRSLEELSGNEMLEIDTYRASLGTLEMTTDVADTFCAVAQLFQHQVGFQIRVNIVSTFVHQEGVLSSRPLE